MSLRLRSLCAVKFPRSKSAVLAVCSLAVAAPLTFAAVAAADGSFSTAIRADGPSTGVVALGDVEMAFDSSAALAYVRSAEGANHVYISKLVSGTPQTPARVDQGQPAVIGKPVVAVGNGGRMAVLFANSAGVWARVQTAPGQAFSSAQRLGGPGSSSPSVDMAPLTGTAYASWSEGGAVRAAYLPRHLSAFKLYSGSLNINPAASAGSTAALAPKVATSADGTAIVAFGENDGSTTRIGLRRLVRERLSSVVMSAGVDTLDGHAGGAAEHPDVVIQADSSFAWVVFAQSFDDGVRRGVIRRVRTSTLEAPQVLAGGAAIGDAEGPTVSGSDRGSGIASVQSADGTIWASVMRRGTVAPPIALASSPAMGADPSSAFAVSQLGVSAWGQSPSGDVYGRSVAEDDSLPAVPPFAAQTLLSNPSFGAVDTAGGLGLATDLFGNTVIAFTQGPVGARSVVVASFSLPAAAVRLTGLSRWQKSSLPKLTWWTESQGWPAQSYRVYIDGQLAGTTGKTSFDPVSALGDGTHKCRVESVDRTGHTVASVLSDLKIDTTIPKLKVRLVGSGIATIVVGTASDTKAPQGSGLAAVRVNFGDGSPIVVVRGPAFRLSHAFTRSGRLAVTVTAIDGAGNSNVFSGNVTAG